MATIGPVRRRLLFLAGVLLPAVSGLAHAGEPRAPVAYYDAGVVMREARLFAAERAQLDRLVADRDAEVGPLERAVHRLRDAVVRGRDLPDDERRDLEARLAQSTIALMVARVESAQEIARVRDDLFARLDDGIVAAVARVASERGLAVVIRTDESTSVLDEDAIDVSALVIDTLDETREAPAQPAPGERRRTRTQSCEAATTSEADAWSLASARGGAPSRAPSHD